MSDEARLIHNCQGAWLIASTCIDFVQVEAIVFYLLTYYCPNCWKSLNSKEIKCPACGLDVSTYNAMPYEEKLLLALNHPVPSRRMVAIEILGNLNSKKSLAAFKKILAAKDEDYYTVRAVIQALSKIDHPQALVLQHKALKHPSLLVRRKAKEVLEKRRSV